MVMLTEGKKKKPRRTVPFTRKFKESGLGKNGGGDFSVKSPPPKHFNIFMGIWRMIKKFFLVNLMYIPIGQKKIFPAESQNRPCGHIWKKKNVKKQILLDPFFFVQKFLHEKFVFCFYNIYVCTFMKKGLFVSHLSISQYWALTMPKMLKFHIFLDLKFRPLYSKICLCCHDSIKMLFMFS